MQPSKGADLMVQTLAILLALSEAAGGGRVDGAFLALPDAEVEKARTELKKAAAEINPSGVRDASERLAKSDQKPAVDALLDGYGLLANILKSLWPEKLKAIQQKEANADFRVNYKTNPPTIVQGDEKKYLAWQEAEKLGQTAEARIMNVEACKRHVVRALASFKGEETVKEMLKEIKGNSNWEKRAGLAEALGQISHPSIPAALAEILKKDSEPQVRIAALDAIRELKPAAPEAVSAVLDQLKHEFWQVKSTAAATLKALKPKEAVEALLEALSKSEGRLRQDMNDALVAVTGVDKHADPNAWRSWWDANKAAFLDGKYQPRPDEAAAKDEKAFTTFYGIPVTSKNVIFILDRSGSMMEPSEWEPEKDVATGPSSPGSDLKPQGNRKIDIARWQLKRALAMIPDGVEFNVIFYSHEWTILSERMLKLSADTRRRAFEFIDRLDPIGPTNIYDPLEKGLAFAAAGPLADKIAKGGVDTIYFLTDGMPNTGQVPNAPDILVKIKELNKTKKVKIHTVGVFTSPKVTMPGQPNEADLGGKFLKQLAEENDGRYTGGAKAAPAAKDMKKP
jgi:hypothetical protein